MISRWGIDMSNPEKQWRQVDKNGGGMVLFDEFCEWAINKGLDLDDDDDQDQDLPEESKQMP